MMDDDMWWNLVNCGVHPQCGLRGVDTRIQRKIGFIDCAKKISYIRYAFLIIHCNILQWNISHSSRFYSRQELHWLGISHCIPLPSLIFDGPRNRMQHFTVPKDVKLSLTKKLDDGWPESVEEQGLLLLVWRHHIRNNILKICYMQSRRGVLRQNSRSARQ